MPVIVARRSSPCASCHQAIVVGERISFTRSTGARHLTCSDDRDDPEDAIVSKYVAYVAQGLDDQRAFDLCVEQEGFVNSVKALYAVSAIAKQREDAYQGMVRDRRERGAARRGGYTFR